MNRKVLQWGLLLSISLGLVALLPGCDKDSDDSDGDTSVVNKNQNDKPNNPSGGGNTGGEGGSEGGEGGGGSTTTDQPPQTAEALKIQWVKIPATEEFLMGSPDSEPDAGYSEKPQHRVKLSGFWMSATEVTNAQYDKFLVSLSDGDPHKESGSNYPGLDAKFKGANQPVVCVSYDDALAFCQWLGADLKVSLPTEAQWEYACRAGSTTKYSFGDALRKDQANIWESIWQENGADVTKQTRAVAQYEKNAFGLYDMHGNVWEWCSDWYGGDYYQKCKGEGSEDNLTENPTGAASGSLRVIRGGSWYGDVADCHSAYRSRLNPVARLDDLGFRVVAPVAP